MASVYNWIITRDCIGSGGGAEVTGPRGKSLHTANEKSFHMYDDDGTLYYSGKIWGEYDGFEPLDDFGGPNAGCTGIKYSNAAGKWEYL